LASLRHSSSSEQTANNDRWRAIRKGFTVVTGGSLSVAEWENVRRTGALKPAGQFTPNPKPFTDDPLAKPLKIVPLTEWSLAEQAWVPTPVALEVPDDVRDQVPTANFFQAASYDRNPVAIRNNVVAKLLGATNAVIDRESTLKGARDLEQTLLAAARMR
jgi:hypothetical protein